MSVFSIHGKDTFMVEFPDNDSNAIERLKHYIDATIKARTCVLVRREQFAMLAAGDEKCARPCSSIGVLVRVNGEWRPYP